MALSKIIAEGVDLTDTFAFTGTVTGAGDVLDATTTVPSEGGAVTTNLVQGLAKVWVSFNQVSTTSTNDSLSVSSLSDLGTGLTQINVSNSFSTSNYTTSGSVIGSTQSWSGTSMVSNGNANDANTTTYYRISCRDTFPSNSGAARDFSKVSCMNNGDLA